MSGLNRAGMNRAGWNRLGTSRAQRVFLRAFREKVDGPEASDWPSPAVLRRWMRRPGFRGAMRSLMQSLRMQHRMGIWLAARGAGEAVRKGIGFGEVRGDGCEVIEKEGQEGQERGGESGRKRAAGECSPLELQRRYVADLFRALRAGGGRGGRAKKVVAAGDAERAANDCVEFLRSLNQGIPLGRGLDFYEAERGGGRVQGSGFGVQ